MGHFTTALSLPFDNQRDVLSDILREGTQRLLNHAIEAEVAAWIDERADLVNERGLLRGVARFGYNDATTVMHVIYAGGCPTYFTKRLRLFAVLLNFSLAVAMAFLYVPGVKPSIAGR